MARADLTRILRIFYSTGLRYLPVVDDENGSADAVVGFLPRARLDREMADLSRAGREMDELPPELILSNDPPDDLIAALSDSESVPVLDRAGNQVGSWNAADTLRAIAVFREAAGHAPEPAPEAMPSNPSGGPEESGRDSAARDGAAWLARLILSEMSFPLFVSDLDGRTLFYNQAFETTILGQPELKKSIRLAEEFLLEVQRTLLARSIQEGGAQGRLLRTRIAELNSSVDIVSLSSDGKLVGYLYIFRAPAEAALYDEIARMLEGKLSYDEVVDDVESHIILSMLARYEQNVSHTAKALKLRRTTLQNKIKRLGLDKRRPATGPIPRHRRTKDELEAERIRDILREAEQGASSGAPESPPASTPSAGHMSDLIGEIARDVAAKRGVPTSGTSKAPAAQKTGAAAKKTAAPKKPASKKKIAAPRKTAGKVVKKAVKKAVKKTPKKKVAKKKTAGKVAKKTATRKKTPAVKKKTAKKKKSRR